MEAETNDGLELEEYEAARRCLLTMRRFYMRLDTMACERHISPDLLLQMKASSGIIGQHDNKGRQVAALRADLVDWAFENLKPRPSTTILARWLGLKDHSSIVLMRQRAQGKVTP